MIQNPSETLRTTIPAGRAGTLATVDRITQLIREGSVYPSLRPLALEIVRSCPERAFGCMASTLGSWAQANMVFRNDVYGVETLQTVPYMLGSIQRNGVAYGDCDDFTIMIGSLAKSIGFPVKVRVIRYDGQKNFGHVVPVLFVRGEGWREVDATTRSGEPPPIARVEIRDSEIVK